MQGSKRAYIVILGSLMSGLGKGIVTSSIGKILQGRGLRAVPIKFDGYLNVDCGTMNPFRHGEVFVLDDGTECDMDFGTYERFLNVTLKGQNSITGGKIFKHVIEKERKGGYLGYDVQIVPHLTDEIKGWVRGVGETFNADVVLIEVGGTVGDLENGYFIEAMRQLSLDERVVFVQLTYVPALVTGEQKTKPSQHANRLIASLGIHPEIIICRIEGKLGPNERKKISMFCNVPEEAVIDDPNIATIYELPLLFEKNGLARILLNKLRMKAKRRDLKEWKGIVNRVKKPKKKITVGITGKYTRVKDSYISISEALVHAGASNNCDVEIRWIETSEIEDKGDLSELKGCDGIIVPGGFGARGTEGKIRCIQHAREKKIPYLGLCFGMQLAVVEWARNVKGLKGANSTEIDPKTPHPVIDLLPEQMKITEKGATMRLGGHDIEVKDGSKAHAVYGKKIIRERFRHRYEVNPEYISKLEGEGLVFSGKAPGREIMQIMELTNHPFFMASQFHPEFTSKLEEPNPLFREFVKACLK
ncbi:MAG: CTP synthase (glutamine hydrolyzing) [Candidatus Micrarchaeota archaeon]|nr:CTP synthase (glutamine hydrolyzing) [Candidatus Micrarchaeota archaeon]